MHYLLSHDSSLCVNDAPRGGMGGGGGGGTPMWKGGLFVVLLWDGSYRFGSRYYRAKEDFLLRKECFNEL